jgi:hypothetical protein
VTRLGAHADRAETGVGPVQLGVAAQLLEQQVVELLPDAGALPVPLAPPGMTGLPQQSSRTGSIGDEVIDSGGHGGRIMPQPNQSTTISQRSETRS